MKYALAGAISDPALFHTKLQKVWKQMHNLFFLLNEFSEGIENLCFFFFLSI